MNLIHATYGIGQVISEENGNITINFNGTIKTLIVKFAGLTNEDGSIYGETFVPKAKKVKKLNKANFMSAEEFAKSDAAKMSKDEWNEYRERKVRESLPSSLR